MSPYTFNIVDSYIDDNGFCFKVWTHVRVTLQVIQIKEISLSHMNIYLSCSSYVKKHILDNVTDSFTMIGNLKCCNVESVLCSLYVNDRINRIIFITCFQVVNIMSLYFRQQEKKDYCNCMCASCTDWLLMRKIRVESF
jgi:hypothetical protein